MAATSSTHIATHFGRIDLQTARGCRTAIPEQIAGTGLEHVAGVVSGFLGNQRVGDQQRLLVAFSGGGDSTALLHALLRRRPRGSVLAAHLDHGLDDDSPRRAESARQVCEALGVRSCVSRRDVSSRCRGAMSVEAVARSVRYRFLERAREELGADYVVTAHHADDQLETLLLRVLQGSGWQGLAGIAPRMGRVLRPALGLRRRELRAALEELGVAWSEDPTNHTPSCARNRLRYRLLPLLRDEGHTLVAAASTLAYTARAARDRLGSALRKAFDLRQTSDGGADLGLAALLSAPPALREAALTELHRVAGRPYPPGASRLRELARQLDRGHGVGCDCGAGWAWRIERDRLALHPPRGPQRRSVSYTYSMPSRGKVRASTMESSAAAGTLNGT